jgi:hypothetical protein
VTELSAAPGAWPGALGPLKISLIAFGRRRPPLIAETQSPVHAVMQNRAMQGAYGIAKVAQPDDATRLIQANITMSTNKEGVNPLRPYYIPPSIGETPEPAAGASSYSHANATTAKYASKARDIFPDIDYKDYISEPSPSVIKTVKDLVDELLWKYTSVLMAQPFEVAKTILQVRAQDDGQLVVAEAELARVRTPSHRSSSYNQVRSYV